MSFYEDMERSLRDAIEIEKGNVPLIERKNMQAKTYVVEDKEKLLIEEFIILRKEKNVSQSQLAEMTGNKQQAISRLEKKMHSPSLKFFINLLNALGYELQIVKKC